MQAARSIIVALVPLALFVHAADPSTAGEALFERAVTAAEHGSYANYATYAVTVRFDNGARHVVDTWKTTEDIERSTVLADIFTQRERRNPTTATGANVRVGLSIQPSASHAFGADDSAKTTFSFESAPLNPQQTGDPVGPVALAVDQNFGLTPPRSYLVTHDVDTFAARGEGLAVIGQTGTQLERYRVTLLDSTPSIDHLGLTPLRDPYHNRLRELWVDATTAAVREAIVAGVGDRAPLDRVRWDVTFAQIAGGTYVAEERALAPVDYGRDGSLRDVHIAFDDLTLTSTFPFAATFGIATPVQTVHDP